MNTLQKIRHSFYRWRKEQSERRLLSVAIRHSHPLNVVVGAGGTTYPGWVSTDIPIHDVTTESSWARLFTPNSIDRLLSEHVFEHLTETQNASAFALCYRYLKQGGRLRIAVPDGNRQDAYYQSHVAPPKDDHQMLFTVSILRDMLQKVGFEVIPLEYFDSQDRFNAVDWNEQDGIIRRCFQKDSRSAFQRNDCYTRPIFYTSLIVDAIKR